MFKTNYLVTDTAEGYVNYHSIYFSVQVKYKHISSFMFIPIAVFEIRGSLPGCEHFPSDLFLLFSNCE